MNILYADDHLIAECFDQNTNQANHTIYLDYILNPVQNEISKLNKQIELLTIQSNMQRQNEALMQSMYKNTTHSRPSCFIFEPFKKANKNKDSEEVTITLKKCSTLRESINQLMDILKIILPKITPDDIDKWRLKIDIDPHKIKTK